MIRIGAMVSGGGTNLQAVLDAIDAGKIDGQVVTVVSSKEGAYAMERAAKHNIPSVVISKKDYPNGGFEKALIDHFKSMNVDLIILAGYMTILGEEFIKAFENKIMNIHPALIPSFCGDFQCFVHITKCCQGNYEGDGNGIFYVFIQVTDDQHLSGETNF